MGDAAAERAARADGMMRDVAHDGREQVSERTLDHRLVKGGMAHAGADAQLAALDGETRERLDPVDVDEMGGTREPERHDGNEALPAGEHAPVLGRHLGQGLDRLLDGLRRVVAKRRRLHLSSARRRGESGQGRPLPIALAASSQIWKGEFFWIDAQIGACKEAAPARPKSAPMKPPPFRYHDPRTVGEAVGLLGRLENAKLLAGGQSLMPMLNMRFVLPDHIIDLNRVEGLSYIRERDGALEIGAMTRQRDLEFSDAVRARFPIMHEALQQVGHRQTRNRGTIGGSLCHLDPAAELVSLATGYDATVTIAGPNGERELPFAEFPVAYMTPAIEPNEIVVAVRFPRWAPRHSYAFIEFSRRHGDFAITSAAALIEADAAAGSRALRSPSAAWARRRAAPARSSRRSSGRCRRASSSATPARAAASSKPSTTCTRRPPTASISRRCSRAAPWRRRMRALARARRRRRSTRGETMGETRKIALTVNGKRYEEEVEVRCDARRFRAPSARAHRHPSRLRARRLRRLHHPVRRALGALLPDAGGAGGRPRAPHRRRHRALARRAASAPAGVPRHHGLQCGFCTPGMLTTLIEFLRDNPDPTEQEVRIAISGNLCRCTGYQNIVIATLDAAKRLQEAAAQSS